MKRCAALQIKVILILSCMLMIFYVNCDNEEIINTGEDPDIGHGNPPPNLTGTWCYTLIPDISIEGNYFYITTQDRRSFSGYGSLYTQDKFHEIEFTLHGYIFPNNYVDLYWESDTIRVYPFPNSVDEFCYRPEEDSLSGVVYFGMLASYGWLDDSALLIAVREH